LRRNGTIGEKNISVTPSRSELGRDMGAKPNDDFLLSEITEKYRDETSSIATKIRSKLILIRYISEIKKERISNYPMQKQNNQLKAVPVPKHPD
jgi:hypothetical protein